MIILQNNNRSICFTICFILFWLFFLPVLGAAKDYNEDVTINGKLFVNSPCTSFPCIKAGLNVSGGILSSFQTPLVLNPVGFNVGIGTNKPQRKLHVVGDRIRLENDGKILDIRADGGAVDLQALKNDLYIRSTGTSYKTNNVIINPFADDGAVAIGTTNPSNIVGLHVVEGGKKVVAFVSPTALRAESESNIAIHGVSNTGIGVVGHSISGDIAVRGWVYDFDDPGRSSGIGVEGFSSGKKAIGVFGGNPSGYAGVFSGDVQVLGALVKSGLFFKIDHPLDRENKYLNHASVESPDMMNIYNGIAVLDDKGRALIQLPEWFEALNCDFHYQLTPIGAPMPKLHIADEISNNRFEIAGGLPIMKVSWQVTGIRQDPWAEKHRIPVEEEKPKAERGFYLHPELFGQPATKSVLGVRYPALMKDVLKQEGVTEEEGKLK